MKRIHIIVLSILFISFFHAEADALCYGRNNRSRLNNGKPFVKRYDAAHLKELKLTNKHGYINLTSWDEEEIVIEMIVNVDSASYYEAEEILRFISFKDRTYSDILDFETVFSDNFFSNYPFTVNCNVKVPKHMKLVVNNTIGDVRIANIDSELMLTQSYGKLELKNIANDKAHVLNLSFVEGDIERIGSVKANFSNCTLNLTDSRRLCGETHYCMASFTNVKSLNLNSFTDRLTIVNSDSLTLKGSHFIGKVEHLNRYGLFELERGQLLVDASETIRELTISNQRVKTTVVIPHSLSYLINGEVFKGTFTHPAPQLLQLFKEDDNVTFSGKISNDTKAQANLILFNKDSSITIKN